MPISTAQRDFILFNAGLQDDSYLSGDDVENLAIHRGVNTALELTSVQVDFVSYACLEVVAPRPGIPPDRQVKFDQRKLELRRTLAVPTPSDGAGGGLTEAQVEALITAHRRIAEAHQMPGLSGSQVAALIDSALLSYATTAGVTQSIDNHSAIATAHLNGAAIVGLLEALVGAARLDYSALKNAPVIPDLTNANLASSFDGKLLKRVTLNRTFTNQLSATDGDAIISTDNNAGPGGATDFVGIDREDAAGNNQSALIDSARPNDYILVELPNDKILLGCIAGIVTLTGPDADVKQVWYHRLYHEGLDTYDSDAQGAGKIYLSEHIVNDTTDELTERLAAAFVNVDGSNVSDELIDAIQGLNESYALGTITRIANDGVIAQDRQWQVNGAVPARNSNSSAQFTIQMPASERTEFLRHFRANAWIEITPGYQLRILQIVSTTNNQYIANVRKARSGGTIPGVNASSTGEVDGQDVHRGELGNAAYSNDYNDLDNLPTIPVVKSKAGVNRQNKAQPTGNTTGSLPGLSVMTVSYTPTVANARLFVRARLAAGIASAQDNDYIIGSLRVKRGTGNYKRMDEAADGYTPFLNRRQWQYWDNGPTAQYTEFMLEPQNNTDEVKVNMLIGARRSGGQLNVLGTLNPTKLGHNTGPSFLEIYEEAEGGTMEYQTTTTLDSE